MYKVLSIETPGDRFDFLSYIQEKYLFCLWLAQGLLYQLHLCYAWWR